MPNAANVQVAVSGAFYSDVANAASAPTGTASSVSAFDNLGFISEDGITLSMPGAGDSTPLKVWQNGQTVRILRTPSEENPTLTLTFVETKLEVIEFVFGVTVTQTSTEGSYKIDTTQMRGPVKCVFDVIDGDDLMRGYLPSAVVTEISEITLNGTSAIGYGVTLELEKDPTAGFQAQIWSTKLKSGSSES